LGQPVKFKRCLRAGTLAYLQGWEIGFLLEYGVRTVIDLRTPAESSREPNPLEKWKEVKCLNIPFLIGDLSQYPYQYENLDALSDMYIHIFNDNAGMVAEAMRQIAAAGEGIILYNCSAGKDRTGVLSYILLSLAGVSREDIIANYQTTETYYLPLFKKFAPDFDKIPIHYLDSKARNMERTIEFIEGRFGCVEDYLLGNGVSPAEIEKVQRRLLF
jgi:protein-tyrosine phosphatase